MKLVEELDIDDSDIDDMYAKNLTLGMTVGKVWIELHGSDTHASAFNEMDINGDSKLTWDEWVHEMFHDQPQEVLLLAPRAASPVFPPAYRRNTNTCACACRDCP
jgi:hypothetical protein